MIEVMMLRDDAPYGLLKLLEAQLRNKAKESEQAAKAA